MQTGTVKANELFVRLSETSDSAVKTREKLFAELKDELELHTYLEEQHLFPILRRNAETKELVTGAIKDNKELRAKIAELEALPKNDVTFSERLKELQKTFRQHARDEKRELLPTVQRALSEEQVQGVAEKIEADLAEAEKARHFDLEERRVKARQEHEQAARQAEQHAAAERAQKVAAAQARQEEAEQKRIATRQEREQAERQAEQEAGARRTRNEVDHRVHDAAETVARTATATQAGVFRIAEDVVTGAQRVRGEIQGAADAYIDAIRTMVPDLRAATSLPSSAVGAMTEIWAAWIEGMAQTTRASTQMSQELLRQAAEQQQRFAADTVQSWMQHNARITRITMAMTQEGFHSFAHRAAVGSEDRRSGR